MTWSGVFPAVTTKMNKDGKIDLPAFQSSIDRLIANGVSGAVVLPMLGENASLARGEKETVIRAAREVVGGRVPLLSGLAEITLDNACETARLMKSWGAEGFMVFPSLGYRSDADETVHWYSTIGRATDLPIMVYNNPIAYGVDVTPAILERLASTPTIVCVKEETGDIRRITDMYNVLGNQFQLFCGVDDLIVESLSLGATGWVSGMTNAWPAECVELFNLCVANRYDEARPLYRLLTPAFHLDTDVKLVQYIKLAEHLVYGAPEWVRSPRLPLPEAERARVAAVIEAAMSGLAARIKPGAAGGRA